MKGYEIHIPGKRLAPAKANDRPTIRISAEAYNVLIEIASESTLSIKDIASLLITESQKYIVYDR